MNFSLAKDQIGLCLVNDALLSSIINDLKNLLTSRVDIVPVSVAAEMLGMSSTAVRYRIKTGKLEAVPVNFNYGAYDGSTSTKEPKVVWYVKRDSLDALISEQKKMNKQKPGRKSKADIKRLTEEAQASNH